MHRGVYVCIQCEWVWLIIITVSSFVTASSRADPCSPDNVAKIVLMTLSSAGCWEVTADVFADSCYTHIVAHKLWCASLSFSTNLLRVRVPFLPLQHRKPPPPCSSTPVRNLTTCEPPPPTSSKCYPMPHLRTAEGGFCLPAFFSALVYLVPDTNVCTHS